MQRLLLSLAITLGACMHTPIVPVPAPASGSPNMGQAVQSAQTRLDSLVRNGDIRAVLRTLAAPSTTLIAPRDTARELGASIRLIDQLSDDGAVRGSLIVANTTICTDGGVTRGLASLERSDRQGLGQVFYSGSFAVRWTVAGSGSAQATSFVLTTGRAPSTSELKCMEQWRHSYSTRRLELVGIYAKGASSTQSELEQLASSRSWNPSSAARHIGTESKTMPRFGAGIRLRDRLFALQIDAQGDAASGSLYRVNVAAKSVLQQNFAEREIRGTVGAEWHQLRVAAGMVLKRTQWDEYEAETIFISPADRRTGYASQTADHFTTVRPGLALQTSYQFALRHGLFLEAGCAFTMTSARVRGIGPYDGGTVAQRSATTYAAIGVAR